MYATFLPASSVFDHFHGFTSVFLIFLAVQVQCCCVHSEGRQRNYRQDETREALGWGLAKNHSTVVMHTICFPETSWSLWIVLMYPNVGQNGKARSVLFWPWVAFVSVNLQFMYTGITSYCMLSWTHIWLSGYIQKIGHQIDPHNEWIDRLSNIYRIRTLDLDAILRW